MFLGSMMSSEKTAAAAGTVGELRFDPFAMLPFCGYNMADYFAHWLEIGRAGGREAAEDLLRQLVPQGRGRPLPVAGLRRELARAGVGVRPLRGSRRGDRDADRPDPARRRRRDRHARPGGLRGRRWPSCCASTSRSGRPSYRSSASTSRNSTACRRSCTSSSKRWRSAWRS